MILDSAPVTGGGIGGGGGGTGGGGGGTNPPSSIVAGVVPSAALPPGMFTGPATTPPTSPPTCDQPRLGSLCGGEAAGAIAGIVLGAVSSAVLVGVVAYMVIFKVGQGAGGAVRLAGGSVKGHGGHRWAGIGACGKEGHRDWPPAGGVLAAYWSKGCCQGWSLCTVAQRRGMPWLGAGGAVFAGVGRMRAPGPETWLP